jgi:2'-5' RNA ligase
MCPLYNNMARAHNLRKRCPISNLERHRQLHYEKETAISGEIERMAEMWRLFIAIELPPAVIAQLTQVQDHLKKHVSSSVVRWVNPNGIHLTLKFLGDAPVEQRQTLEESLAKAVQGHKPFTLAAEGLGCFPNLKQPRVVWIGIHESVEALLALRNAIETRIAPLGYPTEDRAFSPHLTLGRIRREAQRSDAQKFGDLVAHTTPPDPQRWQVQQVSLIRSELKPTGAVYTPLCHAPLA